MSGERIGRWLGVRGAGQPRVEQLVDTGGIRIVRFLRHGLRRRSGARFRRQRAVALHLRYTSSDRWRGIDRKVLLNGRLSVCECCPSEQHASGKRHDFEHLMLPPSKRCNRRASLVRLRTPNRNYDCAAGTGPRSHKTAPPGSTIMPMRPCFGTVWTKPLSPPTSHACAIVASQLSTEMKVSHTGPIFHSGSI